MYLSNLLDFCKAPRRDLSQDHIEVIDLFCGGGCGAAGFEMAGFKSRFAVEYDPQNERLTTKLSACYDKNFPDCTVILRSVQDMQNLKWIGLPKGKVIVASPVCCNYSQEKSPPIETELDISAAIATASAVDILKPSALILEQVPAYATSQSWGIIDKQLTSQGYSVYSKIIDMKDYGIPQLLRKRLIVVASKKGEFTFPSPTPNCLSWWEAIADLELPDSSLLPKQKEAIALWTERNPEYKGQEPLLVERVGNRGECKVYPGKGLAPTLKKSIFTDEKGASRRRFLDVAFGNGQSSQLTARAAARIQGAPDWWDPTCPAAIGNGVPSYFFYQLFTELKNQYFS